MAPCLPGSASANPFHARFYTRPSGNQPVPARGPKSPIFFDAWQRPPAVAIRLLASTRSSCYFHLTDPARRPSWCACSPLFPSAPASVRPPEGFLPLAGASVPRDSLARQCSLPVDHSWRVVPPRPIGAWLSRFTHFRSHDLSLHTDGTASSQQAVGNLCK